MNTNLKRNLHSSPSRNRELIEVNVGGYVDGVTLYGMVPAVFDLAAAISAASYGEGDAFGVILYEAVSSAADSKWLKDVVNVSGNLLRYVLYGGADSYVPYTLTVRGVLS